MPNTGSRFSGNRRINSEIHHFVALTTQSQALAEKEKYTAVQLNEITLTNFRNYFQETAQLSPGVNVLIGRNAQGKTNFLEALYFLGTAKSFRVRQEKELLRWDSDACGVEASFTTTSGRQMRLGARWAKIEGTLKRRLFRNNLPIVKISDFLQALPLVLFVPSDLALVQGSPINRRRCLDVLLCKLSPAYLQALSAYNKVLRQRSELLRLCRLGQSSSDELEPWDIQFAHLASQIIAHRLKIVDKLADAAALLYDYLCPDSQQLRISYSSTCCRIPESSRETSNELSPYIEGSVLSYLKYRRRDEINRGFPLIGPHRDDLLLNVQGHSIRLYGSQGQHRTAALAIRLAEAQVMSEARGEKAIILLDDCFSELDKERSIRLLSYLRGAGQVLITTAHPPDFFASGPDSFSLAKLVSHPEEVSIPMLKELTVPYTASFYSVAEGKIVPIFSLANAQAETAQV